jgi:hypothetical protein
LGRSQGKIATWTIQKTEAARTRIWGCKGHYMGLNMGLFLQTGQINCCISGKIETGDFTGVSGTAPDVRYCIKWAASPLGESGGTLKTYQNDSEKWYEHRFSPVQKKRFGDY